MLCSFALQVGCNEAAPDSGASPASGAGSGGASAGTGGAAGTSTAQGGGGGQGGATTPAPGAVSKPGEYTGYGDKIYSGFELTSQYVAVRDGTKLAMDLYRPKDQDGKVVETKLPVIWMHTPYNRRYFTAGMMRGLSGETYPGAAARLIDYGYVVAIVDFRGLYASYGKNAAYNRGEWVDAARMDAYDITEWLAQQPWSNGKIGMWGCSATGGSQLQATTTAPPSLKAVFPMSCEFDAYPFGVPGGMSPPKGDTRVPPMASSPAMRDPISEPVDGDSDRSQLMAAIADHAGGIENAGYVPFRDSVAANIPEKWWIKSSPHTYLEEIKASGIAIYVAANWDEAATKYGSFFTVNNVTNPSKLIVGPASHCAWFTVQTMTGFDISVEERRFFDHYLKGIDNGVMEEPKFYYYTYNEPAGQEWRASAKWPLAEEKRVPYYLGEKSLGETAPTDASAKDDFETQYDVTPMNLASKGLSYETAPLTKAVRVTGHPVAELWVSSTATDGDFVATLQDVAPDGTTTSYNMHGRLRASLRKEAPAPYENLGLPYHPMNEADVQPLVPGEAVQLRFDLLPISIRFKEGHKIRLVLTFSDAATARLMPPPTVTIHRSATQASSIVLPTIDD
jgi:putative CocE/NonD family hydrolase